LLESRVERVLWISRPANGSWVSIKRNGRYNTLCGWCRPWYIHARCQVAWSLVHENHHVSKCIVIFLMQREVFGFRSKDSGSFNSSFIIWGFTWFKPSYGGFQ
jgi:hypothetical protein